MIAIIHTITRVTITVCQMLAILIISAGIVKGVIIYVIHAFLRFRAFRCMQESRLEIGHSFSLGLSFLIGASILNTIITPTWTDIGQLAAIIAVRTLMNYFLMKDLANLYEERACSDRTSKQ